ncbi:MAG: hypothetical protein H6605_03700 [Flavobacteriales bacterium]|nr:hypothetical protein [Flavobacteriales bacterium]
MEGRSWTGGAYRYGFNGKENDDEIKGNGNQQDYGMRIYDPRLCRFLSVDPVSNYFPWYTPYLFAGNKPIWATDLDGLEEDFTNAQPFEYYNDKLALDMNGAPSYSPKNAAGFARNGNWYFKQLLEKMPYLFDEVNIDLIRNGLAPEVNETWIKYVPEHTGFVGDKLVHHHIDQQNMATALPEKVHKEYSNVLHTRYKAGRSAAGKLGKLYNFLGAILMFRDLFSKDPHSTLSQWQVQLGFCKEGKMYYSEKDDSYFIAVSIEKTYNADGNEDGMFITYDRYESYYYNKESKTYEGFDKIGTYTEYYSNETGKSEEIK